jgi:hypothetical protein
MSEGSEAIGFGYDADHEEHPYCHNILKRKIKIEELIDQHPESFQYINLRESDDKNDYGDIQHTNALPVFPEPLGPELYEGVQDTFLKRIKRKIWKGNAFSSKRRKH